MSSYRQIIYHIVFATKYREPILVEAHLPKLYNYIFGVIKQKNCLLYRIGGRPDHIHILTDLHPSIALADFVKDIKLSSSLFMKESGLFPLFSYWQEGYGAFTHSLKEKARLIHYIKNQREHHLGIDLVDEYKTLLHEHGVPFDERYLF